MTYCEPLSDGELVGELQRLALEPFLGIVLRHQLQDPLRQFDPLVAIGGYWGLRWPEILCGPPDLGPSYYNVAEQLAGFLSLRPVSR